MRFGWIDFIDDYEVSRALINKVEEWAKERYGCCSRSAWFCDLDKQGMLVEGFDEMGTFITIYNYSYYSEHLESYGYVKDVD